MKTLAAARALTPAQSPNSHAYNQEQEHDHEKAYQNKL
jgi:hypothetical protein